MMRRPTTCPAGSLPRRQAPVCSSRPVGSGNMAERLTDVTALALLGDTIPTGAILVVLITVLGPISGARFNPAVSLTMRVRGALTTGDALAYAVARVVGGPLGTVAAHLMFELVPLALSITARTGAAQWWAEVVATIALLAAILGGLRHAPTAIPWLVALTITAASWFTASTSFANPAVAVARLHRYVLRYTPGRRADVRPRAMHGRAAGCGDVRLVAGPGPHATGNERARGHAHRLDGVAS